MRGRVDPEREAAYDAQACIRERARERSRISHALLRGVAAAHDGKAVRIQQLDPANRVEQDRRIAKLSQQRWKRIVVGS